jgi:hypothetical protein
MAHRRIGIATMREAGSRPKFCKAGRFPASFGRQNHRSHTHRVDRQQQMLRCRCRASPAQDGARIVK